MLKRFVLTRWSAAAVLSCAVLSSGMLCGIAAPALGEELPVIGVAEGEYLPLPPRTGPMETSPAAELPAYELATRMHLAAPPAPPEPKHTLRPLTEVVIDTRLPGVMPAAAVPAGAVPATPAPTSAEVPANQADHVHPPAQAALRWNEDRPWMTYEFAWHASGLAHRPTYFEDLNLERYGNSVCPALQPAISGARFAAAAALLPYNMTVHRPRECIYVLGYCRPGNKAPNLAYRPPLQLDAAAVEAAAITGAVFIIP